MDIFDLLAKGEEAEKQAKAAEEDFEAEMKAAKVKKLSPFDFLNSLYEKDYILTDDNVSQYNAFMVNRGMSNGTDTLVHAYIMDRYGSKLPAKMQYDYYFHAVRKGKRYNGWAKEPKYDSIDMIMEIYELSKPKAIEVLNRLTVEELEQLTTWFDSRTGGLTR
ncbi:clamp loader subunit DNA polymerase accessory protein [Vibrio phage nt-1]|uniref:Sliding-clamp-loader small subunit n=1 Tax=Vibrio phage nt-1 TaxID=115992 RepID=R9TGB4_9CAUD|nr:clamp loader of DNA polymerase [Vibrio phage nt-1]AGN30128.2 clamp loader subunit DNA polymerase accessory protein [Vibrio phage nt-1]